MKIICITVVLALAVLACSLTEQTQAAMKVESMSTQTAPDPAMMQPTATGPNQPACVIRTGVTGGHVNMRACAGTGCAVVTILSNGDLLAIITVGDSPEGDKWLHVRTADNLTGYVNSKFVTCEAGK